MTNNAIVIWNEQPPSNTLKVNVFTAYCPSKILSLSFNMSCGIFLIFRFCKNFMETDAMKCKFWFYCPWISIIYVHPANLDTLEWIFIITILKHVVSSSHSYRISFLYVTTFYWENLRLTSIFKKHKLLYITILRILRKRAKSSCNGKQGTFTQRNWIYLCRLK